MWVCECAGVGIYVLVRVVSVLVRIVSVLVWVCECAGEDIVVC